MSSYLKKMTRICFMQLNVPTRDVTELRPQLRKVGISDWIYTSDSGFGSDNFESKVVTKIERFVRGQPECAPTSLDLSAGEYPPTSAYFSIVACHLRMCIIIYIRLIKEIDYWIIFLLFH